MILLYSVPTIILEQTSHYSREQLNSSQIMRLIIQQILIVKKAPNGYYKSPHCAKHIVQNHFYKMFLFVMEYITILEEHCFRGYMIRDGWRWFGSRWFWLRCPAPLLRWSSQTPPPPPAPDHWLGGGGGDGPYLRVWGIYGCNRPTQRQERMPEPLVLGSWFSSYPQGVQGVNNHHTISCKFK